MRDYLIWSRVREKQPWLMYRRRAEASAKDYKHLSRVICTHCSIIYGPAPALVQSTLVFSTDEDLMKCVPDSAGDLGSETETSTKIIMKLQLAATV